MKEENTGNIEILDTSTVDNTISGNDNVEIKETATIKSEVGTSVLGQINGDSIVPTNNPLPDKIDITIKQKQNHKDNNKKVKIVTKRDKIMGIISTVIILLVVLGGGYSIYYFGYLNNPSNFKVKNLTFELGTTLPNSVTNYITSPIKIDDMEYSLDISSVKNEIGTYNYSVKHKDVTKTGVITIKDTIGPVINLKSDLNFVINSDIKKEDVVASCDDLSNCSYDFEAKVDTSTAGSKEINIVAKDDNGNVTTTKANINIIDISKTITCTSPALMSDDKIYKTVIEDKINFDSSDMKVSASSKKIIYYIDYASYFSFLNDNKDNTEYTFDKKTFSYSVNNDYEENNLKSYNDISEYYINKSYTCQ
jgi:hypothetical protein